jgi:hypothetical protein
MSSWLATTISQNPDPRFAQLVSPSNVDYVRVGLQTMLLQKNGITTDLQNANTVTQLLIRVFHDLYSDPTITVEEMNQEGIKRAYDVMLSKYYLNQYYRGKIGYLPVPLPLPVNMSARGLRQPEEIYRGI